MDKIKSVKIGDRSTMALKFQSIQIKKTTANDDYASLIGFDSEDLIEVKIWSLPEEKKSIIDYRRQKAYDNCFIGNSYFCKTNVRDYGNNLQTFSHRDSEL